MALYSIVTGDFQDPVLGKMGFKIDSLRLKVKTGHRARREEEAQLRRRQRRVGGEADSEGPEATAPPVLLWLRPPWQSADSACENHIL